MTVPLLVLVCYVECCCVLKQFHNLLIYEGSITEYGCLYVCWCVRVGKCICVCWGAGMCVCVLCPKGFIMRSGSVTVIKGAWFSSRLVGGVRVHGSEV